MVAYVELNQLGGVGIRELLGNGANSPVLLAAPDLLLVAGALVIVLRVFPLAAGLAAQLAARGRGAVAMLALSQVARAPGTANRMALLLTLAVGLGGFALMFDATLVRQWLRPRGVSGRLRYTTGRAERGGRRRQSPQPRRAGELPGG